MLETALFKIVKRDYSILHKDKVPESHDLKGRLWVTDMLYAVHWTS